MARDRSSAVLGGYDLAPTVARPLEVAGVYRGGVYLEHVAERAFQFLKRLLANARIRLGAGQARIAHQVAQVTFRNGG